MNAQSVRTVAAFGMLAVLAASCAPSQTTDAPSLAETNPRAMALGAKLASDELAGRKVGTEGTLKARGILDAEMADIGLVPLPGGNSYAHPFTEPDFRRGNGATLDGVNLVGLIPGQAGADGPSLVITAHYDHLGTDAEGGIFNGADDNASGVVAALEVARWFSKNAPEHNVIIALLDAEERGLIGARAFLRQGLVAPDMIGANLNFDMVARADKGEIYAVGTYHFPGLVPIIDKVAEAAPLTLLRGHDRPEDGPGDWTYLSDQGMFIRAGIPAIYLGVEDHADYHKTSDSWEKVDGPTFAKSITTLTMVAEAMDTNLSAISDMRKPAAER